jgi:hypothetical protein
MSWFRKLLNLFRRDRVEATMQVEMMHPLAERTRRNQQARMPLAEAYDAAERQFGNLASLQERAREGHRGTEVRIAEAMPAKSRQYFRTAGGRVSPAAGNTHTPASRVGRAPAGVLAPSL